jgi:virulence factor
MMRIGVVGLGGIAQKAYLPVLANRPNVELMFQTRNERVLKDLMARYHVRFGTTDLDALIAERPDAVFVCAATEAHFTLTKTLLEASIPVHLDKPITLSYEESKALVELAQLRATPLMIGFNRRFVPSLIEAVERGRPDVVLYQKNRYLHPDTIRHFIFDDFIHVIDTARFVLKSPIERFLVHGSLRQGKLRAIALTLISAHNHAVCLMDYESGRNEETIEVVYRNEKAIVRQLSSVEWIKDNQSTQSTGSDWTPTLSKRGFETMVDGFLHAIQHNSPLPVDINEVLRSHELAEAIVRELESTVQKQ